MVELKAGMFKPEYAENLQSKLPTVEELEDELASRLSDTPEEVNRDEKHT